MDKHVESEKEKKRKDLKVWLEIQDDNANNTSNKEKLIKFELVFNAIKVRGKDWFTSDNLLNLLKKIKECEIYVTANDVHSILIVFKNQNQDLKFNNFGKSALELIQNRSLTDYRRNDWGDLYVLLSFLIDSIDNNKDDDLVLSDVLIKIDKYEISQMTNLLEIWNKKNINNKKKHREKTDVVEILEYIRQMDKQQSAQDMAALLKQLNKIHALSQLDYSENISDQILNQLIEDQWAEWMCSLAKQLQGCLTENHTTKILNKTMQADAGDMYELVTQLTLTQNHLETILFKLEKSKATDVLKLVDELIKIGFKFDKNSYQNVLNYLNELQTVADVYNLLDRFKKIGVTLETNIVHDIISKLKSDQTVADVCNLLDRFKKIDVTLETNIVHDIISKLESDQTVADVCNLLDNFKGNNVSLAECTAVGIVNKLKFGLTVDNVSTLLKKFQEIKVPPNSNKDNYKNNVVDTIVKKFQPPQIAQNLLELVKTLQEFRVQPIDNTCQQILNCLEENQNAGDVVDLLIALGNLVGFNEIQPYHFSYLPSIDNILKKIANDQSQTDMLKLAKVLIAMGKNVALYNDQFGNKIPYYNNGSAENQELESLLTLNPNKNKPEYEQKQKNFVRDFTKGQKESEEKKESKKSEKNLISKFKTGNDAGAIIGDNGILKINNKDSNINQHDNFNQSDYIMEGKINQTNEASNKKAVLKILGVALAILGILCIILSLTIASEVLLGLLIPGCVLFTAGISILVVLFLNNKHDKPTSLSSGHKPPSLIGENENVNEMNQYPMIIEEEYNGPTHINNGKF